MKKKPMELIEDGLAQIDNMDVDGEIISPKAILKYMIADDEESQTRVKRIEKHVQKMKFSIV